MDSPSGPLRCAPVTVIDVAKHAGVSVMTVSRTLNSNGYVAAATRARVMAAVSSLGYVPSISARLLRHTRTNVLGMLVSELSTPQVSRLVAAVGLAAKQAGQDLFVCLAADDLADRVPAALSLGGLCDGMLFALPGMPATSLQFVERGDIPSVLIGCEKGGGRLATVCGDNHWSAYLATEHLLKLGHRRIAFVSGNSHSGQSDERQRGYCDALRAAGLELDPTLIVCGEFLRTRGRQCGIDLLSRHDRPTAIFCANDEMALGIRDALQHAGLSMPRDVSLVGFDDIPEAGFSGLTSVREPVRDIAEAAVSTLLRQIESRISSSECIRFRNELIVRGSSDAALTK